MFRWRKKFSVPIHPLNEFDAKPEPRIQKPRLPAMRWIKGLTKFSTKVFSRPTPLLYNPSPNEASKHKIKRKLFSIFKIFSSNLLFFLEKLQQFYICSLLSPLSLLLSWWWGNIQNRARAYHRPASQIK